MLGGGGVFSKYMTRFFLGVISLWALSYCLLLHEQVFVMKVCRSVSIQLLPAILPVTVLRYYLQTFYERYPDFFRFHYFLLIFLFYFHTFLQPGCV